MPLLYKYLTLFFIKRENLDWNHITILKFLNKILFKPNYNNLLFSL